MRESILPNIYPLQNYNGETLDAQSRKFIYNIDGLRMGPVRMKQNREEECKLEWVVKKASAL